MIVTIWKDNVDGQFDGFPRGLLRNQYDTLSVVECFIQWETPQSDITAILTSTAVDRGPENPYQEIHFICPPLEKSSQRFYHVQPTQKIDYKIQCFDLNTSQFEIRQIGTEKTPKIEKLLLKIELSNASARF